MQSRPQQMGVPVGHGNGSNNGDRYDNEDVNGASNGPAKGAFVARTDYAPDDMVTIAVCHRNRLRFNEWYASQFPGIVKPPKRDEWRDRVFALGLDHIEKLMPPQMSAEDRFAAALGAS